MLSLLIYEIIKFGVRDLQRHVLIPSFVKVGKVVQTLKRGTQTESWSRKPTFFLISLRNTSLLELDVEIKSNTDAESIVLERLSVIQISLLPTKTEFLQHALLCNAADGNLGESISLWQTCLFGAEGRGITWPESCSAEFAWLSLKCLPEQFL
jgi:hypothetical protein